MIYRLNLKQQLVNSYSDKYAVIISDMLQVCIGFFLLFSIFEVMFRKMFKKWFSTYKSGVVNKWWENWANFILWPLSEQDYRVLVAVYQFLFSLQYKYKNWEFFFCMCCCPNVERGKFFHLTVLPIHFSQFSIKILSNGYLSDKISMQA